MSFWSNLGFSAREKTVIATLTVALVIGSVLSYVRSGREWDSGANLTGEDSATVKEFQSIARALAEADDDSRGGIGEQVESVSFPLDLNKSSIEQLAELPGIGPVLAQRIVDYRRARGGFGSVEELLEVPGIGEKKLALIRQKITISQPITEE